MPTKAKIFILTSFVISSSIGSFFLFSALPEVKAADVNVNAVVPSLSPVCGNGIVETGEECEASSSCTGGENPSCLSCHCWYGCFLAGTEISSTNDAKLPIEKIKVGDSVISYNESTKKLEAATVLKIFQHQVDQYLFINDEFGVTPNHPLYINGQWKEAGKVKIGDQLLRQDGKAVVISSVEIKTGDFLVYNLEVEKNNNYFAHSYLAHNKGPICIPNCNGRNCGSDGCGGSCGTCDPGQNCVNNQCISVPVCGNGIVETGEECEPPNSSGCTNDCKIVFAIISYGVPSATITENSAIINWATNLDSNSLLEWRISGGVWEYSREGLSGISYSELVGNLQAGEVYDYRISATRQGFPRQQDQKIGSFQTLGGPVENCTNGIDDDNDGLVDYLDPDCYCEAIYECADWEPEECPPEGIQTRECEWLNSDVCWNNQPQPEISRTCRPGECTLSCGICQTLNDNLCICEDNIPCCGNEVCESWAEPPEDYLSCPEDCPPECLPDWQCDDWGECTDGIQTRECFDSHACGTNLDRPDEVQSCTPGCEISCGLCQSIDLDQCICQEQIPCCGNLVCEIGEDDQICPEDCVEVCLPNWLPGDWSSCINGVQRRDYQDLNNCPYALQPPPDQTSCAEDCNIACGICQEIDIGQCLCNTVSPCCGNQICEIDRGENNINCPVDCGFPPDYEVALSECLDGIDNDGDGTIDYPADSGCLGPYDESESDFLELSKNILKFLDNPLLEQINKVAMPALIFLAAANTFATFSFFNLFYYLQYLFTQPLAALFRRRHKKWGVVYNSLSKQPIDLAIVRLYQEKNGRLVQSKVTDKEGRYNFLVESGRYYITVTKSKFGFPTEYLKGQKNDVKYLDLYYGQTIEITEKKSSIAYNIPIDPQEKTAPTAKIILIKYLRKLQYVFAFLAVPLAAVCLLISPGLLTFVLLCVHILLFILFYRLGFKKAPKSWGKIFDKASRKPILNAIVRIYDKKYNKLLETRITDGLGRYSFLVNKNIYYLTVEKAGYQMYKSQDIDLVNNDVETIVKMDIGLSKGDEISAPMQISENQENLQVITGLKNDNEAKEIKADYGIDNMKVKPIAAEDESPEVARDSLEYLLKAKDKNKDIKKVDDLASSVKVQDDLEKEEKKSNLPPPEKSIFG